MNVVWNIVRILRSLDWTVWKQNNQCNTIISAITEDDIYFLKQKTTFKDSLQWFFAYFAYCDIKDHWANFNLALAQIWSKSPRKRFDAKCSDFEMAVKSTFLKISHNLVDIEYRHYKKIETVQISMLGSKMLLLLL